MFFDKYQFVIGSGSGYPACHLISRPERSPEKEKNLNIH
jgi:hypothetical protein